jgi:thiol-disulfide isomerase/thioredoxin
MIAWRSMHDRRAIVGHAFLVAMVLGLVGCSPAELTTATNEPQDRVGENSVVVTVVDRAGFDAVLVHLRGKVVLVDCWATWCLPCLAQLPHTLELAEQHHADGLEVITLNFDGPKKEQQVEKVLTDRNANYGSHMIVKDGGSSQAMDDFEIVGGALPHYKLYGRDGKLMRTFALDPTAEKQFTPEDIAAAVSAALAEDTGPK